jgi:hypothetical protein
MVRAQGQEIPHTKEQIRRALGAVMAAVYLLVYC